MHEFLRASFTISLRTLGTAVDDTNALSCYLPSLPYLLERDTLNDLEMQKGRDAPPEVRQRTLNVADKIQNFNDLGAAIENLDAVVSVDTAPAHLAGAMGKETFLLEPFTNDWRWRIGATESPWYPSVRLFKAENDRNNRWGSAVSRLKGALFDRFRVA